MLRKRKEPNTNINAEISRINPNHTANTEHSMISMPPLPVSYQVPVMLPYPIYPSQQIEGESQGQDVTSKKSEKPPPYSIGFCVSSTAVAVAETEKHEHHETDV